jgi:hypothetical protein
MSEEDAGSARFAFQVQGLLVDVDDQDNPSGHTGGSNLFDDAGTKVSFTIGNLGTADGAADVIVSVDGTQVQTWTSPVVPHGQIAQPDGDGFVHGCGRFAAGSHTFTATVGPTGSGQVDDTATNTVSIDTATP